MKDQYYGDVNDYRKYGLLRELQRAGLKLGVCWMLTPDDGREDGAFVDYLDQPAKWRGYDPALFDALASTVPGGRRISHVREQGILDGTMEVADVVPDRRVERQSYFQRVCAALSSSDVIFFDPDNGMETKTRPAGRKNSSKHLMWDELTATYERGHSVLLYQHFIREKRETFVARLCAQLRAATSCSTVHCFRTANVAFLLAEQDAHSARLSRACRGLGERWGGQIQVSAFGPVQSNSQR
jgi:hypothetical protein